MPTCQAYFSNSKAPIAFVYSFSDYSSSTSSGAGSERGGSKAFEVLLGLWFSIKQVLIASGGELRAGWPQGPGLSVQPTSQERHLGFQMY